ETIMIDIPAAQIRKGVELPIHIEQLKANYPIEPRSNGRQAVVAIMRRDDVSDVFRKSSVHHFDKVRSVKAVNEISRTRVEGLLLFDLEPNAVNYIVPHRPNAAAHTIDGDCFLFLIAI